MVGRLGGGGGGEFPFVLRLWRVVGGGWRVGSGWVLVLLILLIEGLRMKVLDAGMGGRRGVLRAVEGSVRDGRIGVGVRGRWWWLLWKGGRGGGGERLVEGVVRVRLVGGGSGGWRG